MNSKTIDALDKLKEVQLELLRLSSALEMMNRAHEVKKEWVGLTDNEVAAIYKQSTIFNTPMYFAQAIEAKLKEKNT